MSVVYSKVIGDSCFGKSAIDEAIEKLESIPVSYLFILICRPYTSRVMKKTYILHMRKQRRRCQRGNSIPNFE